MSLIAQRVHSNADDDDHTSEINEEMVCNAVVYDIESRADIVDLWAGPMYEELILESFGEVRSGRRIWKYSCCTNSTPNLLKEINSELKASLSNDSLSYFRDMDTPPTLVDGQRFKCDIYIRPSTNEDDAKKLYKSLLSFLSKFTEEVFQLGKEKPKNVDISSKWVLIEVSESPRMFAHELYELERAIRLLPDATPEFNVSDIGALVVLLNGNLKDAKRVVSSVQDFSKLQIFKYPVYVGWLPIRNIFAQKY